jgi:hypothetical protein
MHHYPLFEQWRAARTVALGAESAPYSAQLDWRASRDDRAHAHAAGACARSVPAPVLEVAVASRAIGPRLIGCASECIAVARLHACRRSSQRATDAGCRAIADR